MNDDNANILAVFVLCGLCLLLGFAFGHGICRVSFEKEAVSKGVAHWTAIGPSQTEFVWGQK